MYTRMHTLSNEIALTELFWRLSIVPNTLISCSSKKSPLLFQYLGLCIYYFSFSFSFQIKKSALEYALRSNDKHSVLQSTKNSQHLSLIQCLLFVIFPRVKFIIWEDMEPSHTLGTLSSASLMLPATPGRIPRQATGTQSECVTRHSGKAELPCCKRHRWNQTHQDSQTVSFSTAVWGARRSMPWISP